MEKYFEGFQSTNEAYHSDTKAFINWLGNAAAACGQVLPHSDSGTKRKSKKSGHRSDENSNTPLKYKITIKALVKQAEIVATNKQIVFVTNIFEKVNCAIRARRRCYEWFRKTGDENHEANIRHLFFIEVLEKAVDILLPLKKASQATPRSKFRPSKACSQDAAEKFLAFQNRFSILTVEQPTDSFGENQSAPNSFPDDTRQKRLDIYELQSEETSDLAFAVFCFFEDLHRIRDFILGLWQQDNLSESDMISAAVLTNTGVAHVHRAERALIAKYPDTLSESSTGFHTKIACASGLKEIELHDNLGDAIKQPLSDNDKFLFSPTAYIVKKFSQGKFNVEEYPNGIPAIRNWFDLACELNQISDIARWEYNDAYLTRSLMDFKLYAESIDLDRKDKTQGSFKPYIFPDEPTMAFLQCMKSWKVSVGAVFAAQILLDIKDGAIATGDQAYKSLHRAAITSNLLFNRNELDISSYSYHNRGKAPWPAEAFALDTWIAAKLSKSIFIDKLSAVKKESSDEWESQFDMKASRRSDLFPDRCVLRLGTTKGLRTRFDRPKGSLEEWVFQQMRFIPPSLDPKIFWRQNPVLSGINLLRLKVNMEIAAIALVNGSLHLITVAHMYNALKQGSRLMDGVWPDMEIFISAHIKELFRGQLPVTPKGCLNRFLQCTGFSLGMWTQDFKQRFGKEGERYRGGRLNVSKLRQRKEIQILHDWFEKGQKSAAQCAYELESAVAPPQTSASRTPIQFLQDMLSWFPTTSKSLDTHADYISMSYQCRQLLKKMHKYLCENASLEPT